MTDSTGPGPDIPGEVRASVRTMVSSGLRALGNTAVLVAIYYLLPLDHTSTWIAATILIIGLVAFIALVVFQVRWIIRSRFPGLRAVEALATSLPLFLLLFSGTYVVMAMVSASNFGEKLTHTDALYFTVTVFTTVGFGDITAKSEGARLLVTGQMVTDLIILGIGAKIILGAVTRGRSRQPQNADAGQPGP
jgi:voltage-gated potassium channel